MLTAVYIVVTKSASIVLPFLSGRTPFWLPKKLQIAISSQLLLKKLALSRVSPLNVDI
jgi:hypothetical protein